VNQIGAYLNKIQAALKAGKITVSVAALLTDLGDSIQTAYQAGHAP